MTASCDTSDTSGRSRSGVDRLRLAAAYQRELQRFEREHPRSATAYAQASNLFGQVPMTWMNKLAGAFPIYLDRARGARVWDLDGAEYVDFALGDTGAMAGHSPAPTVTAIQRRAGELGGLATMLPTLDAQWVAAELTRRFGTPRWSFALTVSTFR